MNRFLDWVVTEWVVRFQLELKCMSILEVPILWCEDKDPSDFFGRKRQKARSGSFSANLTRIADISFLTSGFMNTIHLTTGGLSIGNHYDQPFHGFKFLIGEVVVDLVWNSLRMRAMLCVSSVQVLAVALPAAFGKNEVEYASYPVVKEVKTWPQPPPSADSE